LVVAEDHLLVREGLITLLRSVPDFEVVGSCGDADRLLTLASELVPDVIVTDIRMPPGHTDEGIRVAKALRLAAPSIAVVVVSQFVDPAYALALLEDGTSGRGYLLKDHIDQLGRLEAAIRTVAGGGSFIDDHVVDVLVRSRSRMVDSPLVTLSQRELEVLAEMASGATNAAIAGSLGVSLHSIEKYTNAIFAKLGLTEDADVNRRVKAVLVYLAGRDQHTHAPLR
jgi:DNA-binding NarL/FixJ family response regulator